MSVTQQPLLSICIPTYNRADWLQACLDSCLPQAGAISDGLVEVVVSDNASGDRTPEVLADYASRYPALKVNRNKVNNWSRNFDTVIQCARGKYTWLLGDDDALLPGAVSLVVALIQKEPRDFYLSHVVVDSNDPSARRLEWFENLPRLDWNLSDPAELLEYMQHGRSASAVFSFISVLIFLREPWLAAVQTRLEEFERSGWPQVATGLEYVKRHGRLRVIPEALVNYHCSTGAWGEAAWDRAMQDLRGLIQVADHFFPHSPELSQAFLGTLRKNHGDGWIAHHRNSAPDLKAWEESKTLLMKIGYDPLKIASVEFGAELLAMRAHAHPGLDSRGLVLADLGFIARGSRRVLVMAGRSPVKDQNRLLDALQSQTLAKICLLGTREALGEEFLDGERVTHRVVDLSRFAGDLGYQEEIRESLKRFAPELVINTDPERHPGLDLMASAAGAVAGVAFEAPARPVEVQVAEWLDSHYTRRVPSGDSRTLLKALGLGPSMRVPSGGAADAAIHSHSFPCEGLMKLNLGCGQEHLDGWVNVDKFPASRPDVVHDLERFPWPFPDGCAEEVLLKHVLEHLGRDSDTFLGIIQELYRVCAPGALVRILVPHPRHQDFLQDPTHVRPVLAEMFQHFSLAVNEEWIRMGLPGTPLAKYLEIDFEVVSTSLSLDPRWDREFQSGRLSREALEQAIRDHNNVVQSSEIVLRALKPFRGKGAASASAQPVSVRWEGSQFVFHSLAHVNRQLCLGLVGSGQVELSLVPYEPDQFEGASSPFKALADRVRKPLTGPAAVHVRHQWPPNFDPPPEGAWAMIQPWEFGGIPAEWVGPMREKVDEIWVPSSWVKECYVKSGIPEDRVVVISNGVDTQAFRPEGERFPLQTTKRHKFLFLGGTIHRKGIDILLEAYRKAFRDTDDVCLVIKGQGGGVYQGQSLDEALERIEREDPQAPEIEYRVEDLGEAQIASLYRTCDALVLPYRGEGFGLPIAEAMASGLPVIVTGRGAAMDFVREDWAYLIPSRMQPLSHVDQFKPSPAGFWLEEPDAEALAVLLRRAYENPEEGREKGRRGRDYAASELTWDGPVRLVLDRIGVLASRRPRRFGDSDASGVPSAPEALLYEPDWSQAEWVEVLLAYLQAFSPGEPVALVLALSEGSGTPSPEAAQQAVLQIVTRIGRESFPDIVIADTPGELTEILARYRRVQPIPSGRGNGEGLEGAFGLRFAQARQRMCGT